MEEAAALKAKGNASYTAGLYKAAEEQYTRALALAEQHGVGAGVEILYCNRAATRLELGDPQGAVADAEAALAVRGSWTKALYRKALGLVALQRHDAALSAAQMALQAEPSNLQVQKLCQRLERLVSARSTGVAPREGAPPVHLKARGINAALAHRIAPPNSAFPVPLRGCNFYLPSPDDAAENLLIMLHGLGDTPGPFATLGRRMTLPRTAVLAVAGPYPVPETAGGRSWFRWFDDDWEPIQARPEELRRVESLAATRALLQDMLRGLHTECGWPYGRMHLFGFSQGGTVALDLVLHCRGAEALGSCVAVSATLLEETLSGTACTTNPWQGAGQPAAEVLLTLGSKDERVSIASVEGTVAALRTAGVHATLELIAGKGHAMVGGKAEARCLMAFWARKLAASPPTAARALNGTEGAAWVEVTEAEGVQDVFGRLQQPGAAQSEPCGSMTRQ